MGGQLKKYLGIGITLLILLQVLVYFANNLPADVGAVADNATQPAMIRMIFGFLEWVPMVLIGAGVLVGGWSIARKRGFTRRFKRRRR